MKIFTDILFPSRRATEYLFSPYILLSIIYRYAIPLRVYCLLKCLLILTRTKTHANALILEIMLNYKMLMPQVNNLIKSIFEVSGFRKFVPWLTEMMLKRKTKTWKRHRIMPFAIDPKCQTESSGLPGHTLLNVGLAITYNEDTLGRRLKRGVASLSLLNNY